MHSLQAQQVVQIPLTNGSRMGRSQACDGMKASARLLDTVPWLRGQPKAIAVKRREP